MRLHVNEESICKVYKSHGDSEQSATVGVLRDLINCRDGINDIDCFNDDEMTVIIDSAEINMCYNIIH